MRFPFVLHSVLKLLAAASLAVSATVQAAEVNLYSARQEQLIKPLLDRFTAASGIQVNLITGKADALLERMEREGQNSPADVLLTTDAGRVNRAKAAGVTQAVTSAALASAIPASFRDPEGHWFGLSLRARPIMYSTERVDPATLSTYEALADPQWRGRICIRSSGNIYNQSLVSSMIAANGIEATETWAKGLVENFARPPQGGDRDQIKAVAAGQCDIAIANTYYLAGMLTGDDEAQREAAAKVAVFWPNQNDRGTHVNVSGAAVAAHAKNRDAAVALIEFLANRESQAWYAEVNGEYPVRPGIGIAQPLASWGFFRMDPLNLARLGELNADALRLVDRAGWK